MRHLKGVLGIAVIGLIAAQTARAELVSIVIGDKMFSDFSFEHCVYNGATAPTAGEMRVSGSEMGNNTIGLYFNAPWYAGEPASRCRLESATP